MSKQDECLSVREHFMMLRKGAGARKYIIDSSSGYRLNVREHYKMHWKGPGACN